MKLTLVLIAGAIACAFQACSAPLATDFASQSATTTSAAPAVGRLSLKLMDSTGKTIYSDDVPNSSLQLKAGQMYSASLAVANALPGATYKLVATQVNVLNGLSLPAVVIVPGTNVPLALPANGQGEYALKLIATVPGAPDVTKLYTADVQCAQPSFTADSLNADGLTVSSSGNNLYAFSAAGVVGNANGMGPYTCAFDPTGTQTQDTAFGSCDQAVTAYVNYVGPRTVGLLVKDACFTVQSVSKQLTLPATTPAKPSDTPFISAQISNAMGAVQNDSRVSGVQYLATNTSNAQTKSGNVVQPAYSNGAFSIQSVYNYQLPSSVNFGIQIQLAGLTDTINVAAGTGSISAANAQIKKVVYTTDQRGDQSSQVQMQSQSCTLSQQGATVKFVQGQPCNPGMSGDNNSATVEVWGHYSCPQIKNADGSSTAAIEGDFNGLTNMADSCVGAPGGSGGGIVPINF